MSKDIGVMGSSDFVLGFNLAGVRRTFPVESKDFPRAIEQLVANPQNVGILIVPSPELEALQPYLRRKVSNSIEPVVIAMGEGAGAGDLREKVKRAIGIDIFRE